MRGLSRTVEQELARIADAQYGVVTRAQLLRAGLSRSAIERRLEKGTLLAEYRGVYRVGHRAPSVEARYLAAVLACGDGAVLSARSAAHLLGLLKSRMLVLEVTTRTERHIDGIRTRRSRSLEPWETVKSRHPNSPGATKLRRILHGDHRVALSKLERRFLQLLGEDGLDLPRTNRPVGGRRVDCHWPKQRVTIELDGYRYHGSRYAWERDRRREREARARGDEFRRYTHGDVFDHPGLMLRELRELLAPSCPA